MTDKEKYRLLCETETNIPLFSQAWWLDTVCGEKNWNVVLVEDHRQIHAAMPFYRPLKRVISMPVYTQTMGPLLFGEPTDCKYTTLLSKRQSLYKQLIDKLPPITSFLQNFSYVVTDWLPFYWEGFQQTTRYTYVLKGLQQKEIVWKNMRPNIQRNIQKAQNRYHISVKKGIPINEFLSVQAQTFKRQRIRQKQTSIHTLKTLIHACQERGQGDIWGGYDKQKQLHAAVFVVWQGNTAWYLAGGGNPTLRNSGAHSLIMWECIQYVSPFTDTFDFEGSMLPGVERFFREFGAIQTPYFTIKKGELSLLDRIRMKMKMIVRKKT